MSRISPSQTRNFCIIAHIDHGKSTLADRLLEITGTVSGKDMKAQVLDAMDLEREKGITIKSHPISMDYTARDGTLYQLNLIDTPGHVDFTYEVSRSLAACEGAILLVDASQGVEAQTLSNFYLAVENGLTIVPALNKIDMPAARPEEVGLELAHLTDVNPGDIPRVSAKAGIGVQDLLEHVIAHVPPPRAATPGAPLQALIFDSQFDTFLGVVVYVRVVEGHVKPGDTIQFASNRKKFEVGEVGVFKLRRVATDRLVAGQVGYIIAGVRDVHDARVGDTVSEGNVVDPVQLPGYREVKPMVFSGLYPIDAVQYEDLKEALSKLKLNDAALVYEPETSIALGFGFRCGFLGLLHMEIVQERLRREYGVDLIATVPSVEYKVLLTSGDVITVDNPTALPSPTNIELIEEPYVRAHVLVPTEYVGNIMKLCQEKRGVYIKMDYIEDRRARLEYRLPLSEIVIDFYDRLKSISRGYASLDYEYDGYEAAELVKLDLLLNGDPVDALSCIVHKDRAYDWGRDLTTRLKELIPKQMFTIAIQAAIGGKIVARETISALRKNVTAKCYGGDITRKRKLLEKQKEGKRRMKLVGTVEVPQEAFLAVLKVDR